MQSYKLFYVELNIFPSFCVFIVTLQSPKGKHEQTSLQRPAEGAKHCASTLPHSSNNIPVLSCLGTWNNWCQLSLETETSKDGGQNEHHSTAGRPSHWRTEPERELHNQADGLNAAQGTQGATIQAASRVLAYSLYVYILNPFKICICK